VKGSDPIRADTATPSEGGPETAALYPAEEATHKTGFGGPERSFPRT
jgi:hypothetical protein